MDYKKTVRSIMNNRSLTTEQQISAIKYNVNSGDYKEALKLHPILNKYLHKDPFFKTIKDVRQKEPFQFTADLKKEYKWVINIIEPFLDQVNLFFSYKNKFELEFITGNFDEAQKVLSDVNNIFGVSLWSIEATLMLEEFTHGSEANWNKLSEFLKEIDNPFYEFIINNSSKRSEVKLSHESYLSQFLNDVQSENIQGMVKDFFMFKNLNFAEVDYSFPNLEGVLYISNIFSVIDQYIILIDVLMYNISSNINNDKLFFPFISLAKEKIPNDSRITNLYNTLNDKKLFVECREMNKLLICMDLYYSGKFNESYLYSQDCINQFPLEYEFYEIYSKSLINLESDFVPLHNGSLAGDILLNTFNLLKFEKSKEDSFNVLFKFSLILLNTNLGKQIFALLTELEDKENRNYITGFLSSSFISPKFAAMNSWRNSVKNNFTKLETKYCYQIQLFKLGETNKLPEQQSLSAQQQAIFLAINSYKRGLYQNTITILISCPELDTNFYYYERKVSLLFHCYLQLNQIENALIIFGDILFDNTFITRKLKHLELYEKIKGTENRQAFIKLIEFSILVSLIVKEYDLYEIYDDFMSAHGLSHIREINIEYFTSQFSLERTIFFLYNICTIDTLKYSTDYCSIGEVEEDRIEILNQLIKLHPPNKLIYEKEINEIYRINSVRKVLKEVDEGRLYIDVNALKDIQIKKFNADFKRFKEIEYSASTQQLIGFNTSSTKSWDKALIEKPESLEKFNSADYLAFKSIYLESRDNFLFSKEYGLDSCLSTRIRHGALKNHIRSVFEKLDLVTSKLNDIYKNNEVWENQLAYYPVLNFQVQFRLKEFSKEIDNYTIFIVEKLIQIQTEKTSGKEEGLLTFFTSDELLFKYYTSNKGLFDSVESTIDMILTSLTNLTLVEVQRTIVDYFENNILKAFQEIIETTVIEIRNFNLPPECQLIPALIKSSTDIQQELESISNWFYLNTTSSTTLLSIETLVDASVELTNKINPNYRINPNIILNCDPFGVYSSQVFVFNILFNNIIEHSHLPYDQVNIELTFDIVEDKYIQIKVSNNVNTAYDFSENLRKLKKIQQDWNDHSSIERSNKEGESGFDKIKRILLYESFSKTDKFDFSFDNNIFSILLFFPFVNYDNEKNTNN